MCEQHIDKKCEKCGWGLPLLHRRQPSLAPPAKKAKYLRPWKQIYAERLIVEKNWRNAVYEPTNIHTPAAVTVIRVDDGSSRFVVACDGISLNFSLFIFIIF